MQSSQKRAFTLIELLVVIAIIAILAAILFPVFAQAKGAAKRTQELSDVKQLTLGIIMYTNDSDDLLPASRIALDNSFFTSNEVEWKDVVYPYIKNGGRLPQSNGQLYLTPGNGGLFQSPLNQAAWGTGHTDGNVPGGPGDETTRFPRSFAVNKSAGYNEFGGSTIWPEIYGSSANPQVYNKGGNQSSLVKPSGTAMIVTTRRMYPDAEAAEMGKASTSDGDESNSGTFPAQFASVASNTTKGVTMGFFDGHAKSSNAFQSYALDFWGENDPLTGLTHDGWNYNRQGPGNGMPWGQGLMTNMHAIADWN